eukprot:365406-Chlamydomonas_euryale.AAC.8
MGSLGRDIDAAACASARAADTNVPRPAPTCRGGPYLAGRRSRTHLAAPGLVVALTSAAPGRISAVVPAVFAVALSPSTLPRPATPSPRTATLTAAASGRVAAPSAAPPPLQRPRAAEPPRHPPARGPTPALHTSLGCQNRNGAEASPPGAAPAPAAAPLRKAARRCNGSGSRLGWAVG